MVVVLGNMTDRRIVLQNEEKVVALVKAAKELLEECGFYSDDPERHDCEFVSTSSEGIALQRAIDDIES